MLQWLYLIQFFLFVVFITLLFLNKQLISLLVIGEVLLILFFLLGLFLSSLYNLYFLIGVSFFILILGGLELSLSIIILII